MIYFKVLKLHYDKTGDIYSSYLSMTLGGLMAILPLLILLFIITYNKRINDPTIKGRFSSIYDGLKTSSPIYLMCAFFFTIRRFALIAITVMLSSYPFFQVICYIFLSKFSVLYLIQVKPYKDRSTNLNEIFNECCVLTSSYTLFLFTDWIDNMRVREYNGYLIIAIILLNFTLNICIQIVCGAK